MNAVPPQPTDEQIADAPWKSCEHHWIAAHQPDFPDGIYWVSRCSQCGHYNGSDLAEQLDAALRDARAENERLRSEAATTDWQLGWRRDAILNGQAEVERLTGIVQAVEKITHDDGGYTTWDQDAKLGELPWTDNACREWEKHHGHDPRLKCYPEYGCQLLIDPEDLRAALTGGTNDHA